MATNEELRIAVDALASDIFARVIPSIIPVGNENEYELAARQYDTVNAGYNVITQIAKRLTEMAEESYENAIVNLRKYESTPGIAKSEYRR